MSRNGILVVGSANMDMVVVTKTLPQPGETLLGDKFAMFPGGKGANQAVCCGKLGGKVYFIGKMGKDVFRSRLMQSMQRDGVNLQHLLSDAHAPTGVALINVDACGQNVIVVVSGSNMKLTPDDVRRKRQVFAKVSVLLLQLEIPLATVVEAVRLAKRQGVAIVLNPAPARALPRSLLRLVDFLTPNEIEAELLTGVPVRDCAAAEKAARQLLSSGVKNVIITLGDKGCLLVNAQRTESFPAFRVRAVDTTAAGDAFNGGLALSLAEGRTIDEAIGFASSVAAYAVTKMGAQSSMPTKAELRKFLA